MTKQKRNKKIVVGVTGAFGSGKSTVARIFASYGAKIIDADKIAHASLKRGADIYKKIVSIFGMRVIGKNKEIDRKRLAEKVFNDERSLKKLESVVHPAVIRIIKSKIGSIKKGVVVLDAPLLLEAGLKKEVDKLIVVKIDKGIQLRRLFKKTSLKKADISKRIRFQISQKEKSRFADFIIDNSATLKETRKQAAEIRRKLWKS